MVKREHGAVEVSQQSHNYMEQKQFLKASLIMRHRPDLLGELINLKPPEGENVEALKAFCEKVQERRNRAAEIADDIFPIDFHIYEIKWSENDRMRIGVETVWQVLDGSFSGYKKTRKQLEKLFKRLYLHYLTQSGCYKAGRHIIKVL